MSAKKQMKRTRELGAGLIEFALLTALIAVVMITSLSELANSASKPISKVAKIVTCSVGKGQCPKTD